MLSQGWHPLRAQFATAGVPTGRQQQPQLPQLLHNNERQRKSNAIRTNGGPGKQGRYKPAPRAPSPFGVEQLGQGVFGLNPSSPPKNGAGSMLEEIGATKAEKELRTLLNSPNTVIDSKGAVAEQAKARLVSMGISDELIIDSVANQTAGNGSPVMKAIQLASDDDKEPILSMAAGSAAASRQSSRPGSRESRPGSRHLMRADSRSSAVDDRFSDYSSNSKSRPGSADGLLYTGRSSSSAAPGANPLTAQLLLSRLQSTEQGIPTAVVIGCELSGVHPSAAVAVPDLKRLDLGDNAVKFSSVRKFEQLVELGLYCNALKSLKAPKGSFQFLQVLNVSFNMLTGRTLRHCFNMPNLKVLDASHNNIDTLPTGWDECEQLQVLNLEGNKLKNPETFTKLGIMPSLEELNLASNRLYLVPDEAIAPGMFGSLCILSLVNNKFMKQDYLLPLSSLPNVEQVDVWGNPCIIKASAQAKRKKLKPSVSGNLSQDSAGASGGAAAAMHSTQADVDWMLSLKAPPASSTVRSPGYSIKFKKNNVGELLPAEVDLVDEEDSLAKVPSLDATIQQRKHLLKDGYATRAVRRHVGTHGPTMSAASAAQKLRQALDSGVLGPEPPNAAYLPTVASIEHLKAKGEDLYQKNLLRKQTKVIKPWNSRTATPASFDSAKSHVDAMLLEVKQRFRNAMSPVKREKDKGDIEAPIAEARLGLASHSYDSNSSVVHAGPVVHKRSKGMPPIAVDNWDAGLSIQVDQHELEAGEMLIGRSKSGLQQTGNQFSTFEMQDEKPGRHGARSSML